MNQKEKALVRILKDLRDNYGAVEVKAEFESEGARLNELMRLKDIASSCGMGIVLKIGGGEAIRDIHDARILGVSSIVAPMVETPYALQKFLEAVKKHVPADEQEDIAFAVNIETLTSCQNLDAMLALPGAKKLSRVTVGRVDLSGSMGLERKDINSEQIFEITKTVFDKSKKAGLSPTLGGAISVESIPFIQKLVAENLLDRFETRKVVFDSRKGLEEAREAIKKSNSFEMLWLATKHDHYNAISLEDKDRIRMIQMRCNEE